MSLSRSHKLVQIATERARELRKNQTRSERRLWQALRGRKLGGWKFLRQHPILVGSDGTESFVVADFYCAEAKLIVEVDGPIHARQQVRDGDRDFATRLRGYRVLRVTAKEVETQLPEVLATIQRDIENWILAPGF